MGVELALRFAAIMMAADGGVDADNTRSEFARSAARGRAGFVRSEQHDSGESAACEPGAVTTLRISGTVSDFFQVA
jgi:hypothetical protein